MEEPACDGNFLYDLTKVLATKCRKGLETGWIILCWPIILEIAYLMITKAESNADAGPTFKEKIAAAFGPDFAENVIGDSDEEGVQLLASYLSDQLDGETLEKAIVLRDALQCGVESKCCDVV